MPKILTTIRNNLAYGIFTFFSFFTLLLLIKYPIITMCNLHVIYLIIKSLNNIYYFFELYPAKSCNYLSQKNHPIYIAVNRVIQIPYFFVDTPFMEERRISFCFFLSFSVISSSTHLSSTANNTAVLSKNKSVSPSSS